MTFWSAEQVATDVSYHGDTQLTSLAVEVVGDVCRQLRSAIRGAYRSPSRHGRSRAMTSGSCCCPPRSCCSLLQPALSLSNFTTMVSRAVASWLWAAWVRLCHVVVPNRRMWRGIQCLAVGDDWCAGIHWRAGTAHCTSPASIDTSSLHVLASNLFQRQRRPTTPSPDPTTHTKATVHSPRAP